MITISICMIVKDEEDCLARCLQCASAIADEIIVVDTGSVDTTKAIARKFTPHIYDFAWCDDFSAARNFSFSKGTKDYLMWMDADDIITPSDLIKLQTLKQTLDPAVDVVMMRYNTGFDADGHVTFSYFRERLIKNHKGYRWMDPVHEYIPPTGRILNADCAITHQKTHPTLPGRNLNIYRKMQADGVLFTPRNLFYFARELYQNRDWKEAVCIYEQFLHSEAGWIEDVISACCDLSACYLALEEDTLAILPLLRSFRYGRPRAEVCCRIGSWFKGRNDFQTALFWFETAIRVGESESDYGFAQYDYRGYIPYLEMCVCHDRLGDHEKAAACNEQAAQYHPGSPAVAYNRRYFDSLTQSLQSESQSANTPAL